MSLGTGDPALARLRGLMLDAEFERNVVLRAAGQPLLPADFSQALTRYRDRLIAEHAAGEVGHRGPAAEVIADGQSSSHARIARAAAG